MALFLVADATAVVFAANLTKRCMMNVSWHMSSSASWANTTWQLDMRVEFEVSVLSLAESEEALAWISATFVAFPLVALSTSVVLEARETNLEREDICLHWSASERALVELPFAATEARRREARRGRLIKCILT